MSNSEQYPQSGRTTDPFGLRDVRKEAGKELGLGKGFRPKSVVEVMEKCFGIDFNKAIDNFVLQHSGEFGEKGHLISVSGFRFHWIKSVLEQPMYAIWMDLVFRGTVRDHTTGRFWPVDIAARACLDLRPCHQCCTALKLRFYSRYERDELFDRPDAIKLNQYLLPYIKNSSYSALAMKVLEHFYPTDLRKSDEPISGDVLADAINIKRIEMPFNRGEGETDMGRMVFIPDLITITKDDGTEADYNLDSNAILLNTRCCTTKKDRNETILHECVHFILDRFFYFLQYAAGRRHSYALSRSQVIMETEKSEATTGRQPDQTGWSPVDWMEYHAEKLPIYLVLNELQTKRCLDEWIAEAGGVRTPEVMQMCIDRLSEKFEVSKSTAKIRMLELGYTQAQGVYNFDKNHRKLRDYGCHEWKEGIGYCIELDDLTRLLLQDERLNKVLSSGKYIYVENRLCLNHPMYVRKVGKEYRMTDYGNRNLDECCISFSHIHPGLKQRNAGTYAGRDHLLSYASRMKKEPETKIYRAAPVFRAEASAAELFEDIDNAWAEKRRWAEVERNLNEDDFGASVKLIMEKKNLTQEEIALRLDVSRTMVQNLLANDRLSLSHVVAICLALEAPYYISEKLVKIAGFSLNSSGISGVYREFLLHPEIYTLERCNAVLSQLKMKPFFEK